MIDEPPERVYGRRVRYAVALGTALALIAPATASAARVPLPPSLTVHDDTPCPDEGGSCSYTDSDAIYLAPGTGAAVRYHEIGHQFDRQVLTDADRAWFIRLLDVGSVWEGPVEETFADAYAACATRPIRMVRRHGMRVYTFTAEIGGYVPTIRQFQRACNAIAVTGLVRLAQR